MNVFDELDGKESVFRDKRFLDHRFLPDRLPHREEQIRAIAKYWVEALKGITPPNITIYGKAGTGKTAVAKFAMKQLNEASKDSNVRTEYIRCTDYSTEYQVLARLCQQFGKDVPYRGWTKAEVINTFRSLFRKDDSLLGQDLILIVVLDEIDILLKKDGDGLLYTLTRTDNVSVLLISNYVGFKRFIGPRVRSSLRDREIVFPPYAAPQLVDILRERSRSAFNDGVLEDDVIPLCAALAAREDGDARYALDLLRTAGEIADKQDSPVVKEEFVREAKDYIEHNKVTDIVMTLPSQQQRVLEAILHLTEQNEEITSGRLYEVYKMISQGDSVSYRRIFDFVNELELLGLISTETVSKGRGKGRTNIIKLQCDTSILENALWM